MRFFTVLMIATQMAFCSGLRAQADVRDGFEPVPTATAALPRSHDAPALNETLTDEDEAVPTKAGESIPRKAGGSIPRKAGESIPKKAGESITTLVRERVRAWFTVIEAELGTVDYGKAPRCSPEDVPYINLVVHIQRGSWAVLCGNMSGPRGPPLAEFLNNISPTLPEVDVMLPFGMHDGVQKRSERESQHVPVLGAVYHKRYSQVSLPFAMGSHRAASGYVNTPVIGWDNYVKTWSTCKNKAADIKKAVFRGKASQRAQKYGACTNACSWKDNGPLYAHSLGQEYPLLFDAAATNANKFRLPPFTPKQRTNESRAKQPIPFPEQLCNYYAILNIGNNLDWAERLRQSFYGNAVIMLPEDPPHEFFNTFMEPYVHYWPLKADLSDTVKQVVQVLALDNLTEQVQGQRSFAAKFLSEKFMIFYNRMVMVEYDRRARMFTDGAWKAPGTDEVAKAKSLLRLRGCEQQQYVERTCPTEALA